MSRSKVVEVYFATEVLRDPGPGGWGVLLRCGDHEKELSGNETHICQNRLDTMALIAAFSAIKIQTATTVVFSDSDYVKKCVTGKLPVWRLRNWREPNSKLKSQEFGSLEEARHSVTPKCRVEVGPKRSGMAR